MGMGILKEIFSRLIPTLLNGKSLSAHADAAVRVEVATMLLRLSWPTQAAAHSSGVSGQPSSQPSRQRNDTTCSSIEREEAPLVAVVASGIPNAGMGVIARSRITQGRVITLYPGLYFPPLPDIMTLSSEFAESAELVTLVKPTSGGRPDDNDDDYLINSIYGGFVSEPNSRSEGLSPMEGVAWCGHRIQHPAKSTLPNVEPVHFKWLDVLQCKLPASLRHKHEYETANDVPRDAVRGGGGGGGVAAASRSSAGVISPDLDLLLLQAACRGARMHQGTHYVDYRSPPPFHGNSPSSSSSSSPRVVMLPSLTGDQLTYWRQMNGIVIVANRDIAAGEELFMDYAYSAEKARRLPWYHPVGKGGIT